MKKNKGLIIMGLLLVGALTFGYITGNEDKVFDVFLGVGLFFMVITVLVTIHELGHYMAAKAFGIRVEKFAIGFPPKVFSFTKGETEYQIGATPIGGYVKLSGIIDETFGEYDAESPAKDYEYRSKPLWQRFIVMIAGIVMNVILGIAVFSGIFFSNGQRLLPMSAVNRLGIEVLDKSIGSAMGFKTGDKLLTVNGEIAEWFGETTDFAPLQSEGYYEVKRNGEKIKIDIKRTSINLMADTGLRKVLFYPTFPAIIAVPTEDSLSAAKRAGLQTGDVITSLDGQSIKSFSSLAVYIKNKRRKKEHALAVVYTRNSISDTLAMRLSDEGFMGVGSASFAEYFEKDIVEEEYSFFEALGLGSKKAFGIVSSHATGLGRMVDSEVKTSKLMMGPFRIFQLVLEGFKSGGWSYLLYITAVLSMILAFMNFLPIPALDGGFLIFLLYEAITRRKPSAKAQAIAINIGWIFIILLMAFVLINDPIQAFF